MRGRLTLRQGDDDPRSRIQRLTVRHLPAVLPACHGFLSRLSVWNTVHHPVISARTQPDAPCRRRAVARASSTRLAIARSAT